MEEKKENLYERLVSQLKNNWLIVIILLITAVIMWFSQIIESVEKIDKYFQKPQIVQKDSLRNPVDNIKVKENKKQQEKKEVIKTPTISQKPFLNEPINPKLKTYILKIEDENEQGVSGVEIYCPNCHDKAVISDAKGYFTLKAEFPEITTENQFQKSTLSLSKGGKRIKKDINWLENSPEPIKF